MTLTASAPAAQAIWADMRMWTVTPHMVGKDQSGWSVLRDGIACDWFPDFTRAVNEAQHCNRNELLRIARLRGES